MTDPFATVIKVRASSMGDLFDCAARWKAIHIDEMRSPSTPASYLGTAIHAATAKFDQARVDRSPITPDDAAGVLVDMLQNPTEEVDWTDKTTLPQRGEAIGIELVTKYALDIAPRFTYDLVEATCQPMQADVGDGVVVELTGHVDRRYTADREHPEIEAAGAKGTLDVKSGKRAVKSDGTVEVAKHGYQLATYEALDLMLERTTREPITAPAVVAGLNTSNGLVGVGRIKEPSRVLLGTANEPGLLDFMAQMFKHDFFPGNPRSTLCTKRYCPVFDTCRWRFAGAPSED